MAYLQLTRCFSVPAVGQAPLNVVKIPFPTSEPFKSLTAWARVTGGTINTSFQPLFCGGNDGSAVAIVSNVMTKVFLGTVDELRPATNPFKINTNAGDTAAAQQALWEVQITNSGAAAVTVNLYIIAALL